MGVVLRNMPKGLVQKWNPDELVDAALPLPSQPAFRRNLNRIRRAERKKGRRGMAARVEKEFKTYLDRQHARGNQEAIRVHFRE